MSNEDTNLQVEVRYLRQDLKDLADAFKNFMGKQDGRFEALSQTYVRKDILDIKMDAISKTLNDIKKNQDKITCHVPMLEEIKKERESLKNQLIQIAGKVLFYLISGLIALYIVLKK